MKLIVMGERWLLLSGVVFGTSLVLLGGIGLWLLLMVLRLRIVQFALSLMAWVCMGTLLAIASVIRFLVLKGALGWKLAADRVRTSSAGQVYVGVWMKVRPHLLSQ